MFIFKEFGENEISEAQVGTETIPAWIFPNRRNNPKKLSSFGLHPKGRSLQTTIASEYFYKVYDRTSEVEDSDAAKYPQFTVTYGNKKGEGSPRNQSTKAIYNQYANSILPENESDFGFGEEFYAINFNRRTMKKRVVPSSFSISLHGKTLSATSTGQISNKQGNEDVSTAFFPKTDEKVGQVYPNKGIVLFSPSKLGNFDQRFQPSRTTPVSGKFNHERFFEGIEEITLEVEKQVILSTYEVNIGKDEFNHSLNPTYSDQNGNVTYPGPNPYFTGIGLYNDDKKLLAVAKLQEPKQTGKDLDFEIQLSY